MSLIALLARTPMVSLVCSNAHHSWRNHPPVGHSSHHPDARRSAATASRKESVYRQRDGEVIFWPRQPVGVVWKIHSFYPCSAVCAVRLSNIILDISVPDGNNACHANMLHSRSRCRCFLAQIIMGNTRTPILPRHQPGSSITDKPAPGRVDNLASVLFSALSAFRLQNPATML